MSERITIVGVGDDGIEGLTRQAQDRVDQAGTLFGPAGLLAKVISVDSGRKVELSADLEQAAAELASAHPPPLVMLSNGDPLFYGTARFLCERLGKERFEVMPHVSSMQLAFARVKESWDEAYLTNLKTQSLGQVVQKIRGADRVGVFTTDEATPAMLAQAALQQGIDYFTAYVCEDLGSPHERVTVGSLPEIAQQPFSDLNVMILVRDPEVPDRPITMQGKRLFGNTDQAFLQDRPSRVLMTPKELRVLALAELDLGPSSVVWDIGAGTGSVAIEAAQIASQGQVYAIEMDPEDFQLLVENAQVFNAENLTPILGEAPEAWEHLPTPDAIFLDGSGRSISKLASAAWEQLRAGGRLVSSIYSLGNVTSTVETLRNLGGDPQLMMLNISRGQQQLDALRLETLNPAFLLTTIKSST